MNQLEGVTVLDLSRVFSGPSCAQALADLGANVLKIEGPEGDDARTWAPLSGNGFGTIFLANNRGKRSIVIDLKKDEGRGVLKALTMKADVLIENFTPGVTQRLGIDYRSMSAVNPRLIYCSISAFGTVGPWSEARGYDNVLQAFSGMMRMTGEEGGAPVRTVFSPVDQAAAQNALSGILAALFRRTTTNQGTLVEVSLLESALALMTWNFQILWATGREPQRTNTRNRQRVPYEVFDAADGHVLIACGNESIWARLCTALEHPEWADDPRFRTNADRARHYEAITSAIREVTCRRPAREIAERLIQAGVPASPLHSLEEVLAHPQTAASGIVQSSTDQQLGEFRSVGLPIRFDGQDRGVGRPPPLFGAHTREILVETGFPSAQIDRLLAEKVVYCHVEEQQP